MIIPYGKLDGRYFSEYLMIEYVTEDDNNSYINSHMNYWQSIDSGIRVYHIQADLQEDYWYAYFKYQNGSEYTNNDDDGIRLIRLAGASLVPTAALPCRDGQRFAGLFNGSSQTADADGVGSAGNLPAILPDGEAAVGQREGDSLGFARLQEYLMEALQLPQRAVQTILRGTNVELHHLRTGTLASVPDGDGHRIAVDH